jgi:hypothetical protein
MHAIERFIAQHPFLSGALLLLLWLVALGLASRDDVAAESLAVQQHAEMQAWEQGYRQGRATACVSRATPGPQTHQS